MTSRLHTRRDRGGPSSSGVPPPHPRRRRKGLGFVTCVVVLTLAAGWVLRAAVVDVVVVASDSMVPTVCDGDRLLLLRARAAEQAERGDLVTFTSPDDGEPTLKRVVAVGGETLAIRDAVLHVDGQAVRERYVDRRTVDGTYFGPVRVPVGAVFLMGDNRELSVDSRDYGAIPRAAIEGKVLGRLGPSCPR